MGFSEEEMPQTCAITSAMIEKAFLQFSCTRFIYFSLLCNRSEGKLVQSQQTKMGAEEKKPSRKTYSKQTFSNKAICQTHIPLLLTQLSLIATHYN